jgi:hypothetical protein
VDEGNEAGTELVEYARYGDHGCLGTEHKRRDIRSVQLSRTRSRLSVDHLRATSERLQLLYDRQRTKVAAE